MPGTNLDSTKTSKWDSGLVLPRANFVTLQPAETYNMPCCWLKERLYSKSDRIVQKSLTYAWSGYYDKLTSIALLDGVKGKILSDNPAQKTLLKERGSAKFSKVRNISSSFRCLVLQVKQSHKAYEILTFLQSWSFRGPKGLIGHAGCVRVYP